MTSDVDTNGGLSEEVIDELERLLSEGAKAHGFEGERWTYSRIAEFIEQEHDQSVSASAIFHYLDSRGLSDEYHQRIYNELFEAIPAGLLLYDPERDKIIDINQFCVEMIEKTREDILGRPFSELHTPASQPNDTLESKFKQVSYNSPVQFECEFKREGKDAVPAEVQLIDVTLNGNQRVLAHIRDISEQKERKQELQRRRNLIATLFETFPEPIAHVEFVDERPVVLTINKAFTETFGFEEEEIIGQNLNEAIVPEYNPGQDPMDNRGGKQAIEKEVRRVAVDGERDFLFRSLPIPDQRNDEIFESIGVYVDITEQKKTRRKLEELNTRLQLALEETDTGVWELDLETSAVIWDEASERLFGYEPGEFPGTYEAFRKRVDTEDLQEVERKLVMALEKDDEYKTDFRVYLPDGSTRWLQARGIVKSNSEGNAERMLGIQTDITERKQREREIERERELNRSVQETLVKSQNREDLEQTIAMQLRDQGYPLVWFAEQVENELCPRVIQGDPEYVERIDWSKVDDSEPCVWAAQTGEPNFIQDFATLFSAGWCDTALVEGYRSGAGIPLVHNEVSYGVLGVYHNQPSRFSGTEQRLLRELADNVAFAIHSLETESALASDHVSKVTLTIHDETYYFVSLARNKVFADCEGVRVHGTVKQGNDSVLQYLTISGGSPSDVREALEEHPHVTDVTVITEGDSSRFQVTTTTPVPELQLASHGAVVRSTVIETGGAHITIEVPAREDIRPLVESLENNFGAVSVRSVMKHEPNDRNEWTTVLTEKQETALEAAYRHGYFEQPRQNSATEIANSLGITHSTFLQHLRAAQQKLFGQQFNKR